MRGRIKRQFPALHEDTGNRVFKTEKIQEDS